MGRLITIGVVVASLLLIWKGGVLDSVLPQPIPPPLDPGPIISKSGDAMQSLKSVHLSLNGTLVLNGIVGVKVTGSGDLIYPHKENLSLQLQVPTANGQIAIVAVNERIENGHEYMQYPAQGPAWKEVTGNSKGQVAPGMDPIANLEFAHAFRASDDLGDITMDNIAMHHFSLTVDPGKYVEQLKAECDVSLLELRGWRRVDLHLTPNGQTPTFSRSRSFSAGLGGWVPYCRRSSSVRCPAAIINST